MGYLSKPTLNANLNLLEPSLKVCVKELLEFVVILRFKRAKFEWHAKNGGRNTRPIVPALFV